MCLVFVPIFVVFCFCYCISLQMHTQIHAHPFMMHARSMIYLHLDFPLYISYFRTWHSHRQKEPITSFKVCNLRSWWKKQKKKRAKNKLSSFDRMRT